MACLAELVSSKWEFGVSSTALTDFDVYLWNEGNHFRAYEKLGAHLTVADGKSGVRFAVWAPNATSVSLVGDFNEWDPRRHPMRKHIPAGFWALAGWVTRPAFCASSRMAIPSSALTRRPMPWSR